MNENQSIDSNEYLKYFLIPLGLYIYSDNALMIMEYAELGTLVNLLRGLVMQPRFSMIEHEYIAAIISYQVS